MRKAPATADAILCADIHLRETVPECRTDDFLAAMFRKLDHIRTLQEWHGRCTVLCAGDLFDHWKPSPWLLQSVIPLIRNWVVVPGQHDLPQHSLGLFEKTGLAVLEQAGCCRVIKEPDLGTIGNDIGVVGFPWKAEVGPVSSLYSHTVALIHRLVYQGRPPFPGAEEVGDTARALLRRMSGFDLVVSGDNHQSFVYEGDGLERLLVNPGSMMRTTAAQADHEPCVFLWWAKENRVERVVLPYERGVVSREHIDKDKARDERIAAFVERLRDDVEIGLDFRDNLRRFLAENNTPEPVEQLIWEVVDGVRT